MVLVVAPREHKACRLGLNVPRLGVYHARRREDGLNNQIVRPEELIGAVVVRALDPPAQAQSFAKQTPTKRVASSIALFLSASVRALVLIQARLKPIQGDAPLEKGLCFSIHKPYSANHRNRQLFEGLPNCQCISHRYKFRHNNSLSLQFKP